jgi:hypothetical protein
MISFLETEMVCFSMRFLKRAILGSTRALTDRGAAICSRALVRSARAPTTAREGECAPHLN